MLRGSIKLFITHAGVFHADDALACAIIQWVYGRETPIARRDPTPEEMAASDIIVADVGGVHDPVRKNFDHHQRGGAGTRTNGVPYAGAGLVWEGVKSAFLTGWERDNAPAIDVWEYVDRVLVQPIDAWDTGHTQPDPSGPPVLHFSQVISGMNSDTPEKADRQDGCFHVAVALMYGVLDRTIWDGTTAAAAKATVLAAPRVGAVLLLDTFVPWQASVHARPDAIDLLYVAYPSARGGWNVQAVPTTPGGRESKKLFPGEWRGAAEADLPDGVTFCHPAGFIGGATTQLRAVWLGNTAAKWGEAPTLDATPAVLDTTAPTLDA